MTQEQIPPKEEIAPLEPTLHPETVDEVQELKDKNLRLLAEMENTRKRLIKEKQDMSRFAVENVIAEFLTPMDNLENALKHTGNMSEETRNWAFGFNMILNQFKEILSQNGINPFESKGEIFDPYLHEAVEVEEREDCVNGVILEEFVKGYKSNSRTIRPARVKVAKKTESAQTN
jgi:molecular chaperone GrpE